MRYNTALIAVIFILGLAMFVACQSAEDSARFERERATTVLCDPEMPWYVCRVVLPFDGNYVINYWFEVPDEDTGEVEYLVSLVRHDLPEDCELEVDTFTGDDGTVAHRYIYCISIRAGRMVCDFDDRATGVHVWLFEKQGSK